MTHGKGDQSVAQSPRMSQKKQTAETVLECVIVVNVL